MINRRNTTLAGLAIAALALAACSTPTDTEADPAPTVTVTSTPTLPPEPPAPTTTPTPTSSLTPLPDGPPVLTFGEPFDYSDGISVNVANLGVLTASDYAYGAEETAGQVVELELSITNNTEAAWDPAGADGTLTYGNNGVAATEVFSIDQGWSGGYFTGTLLPGRTATVNTAYAVPNYGLGDLVYEFTPDWGDWERGAVIYVSQPQQ